MHGDERGDKIVPMPPPQHPLITLAILAGGEGSRMGRPKGMLEIAGQPILAYLLDRFAWPGPTLLVTAPGREHPPAWERFDREVSDPVPGLGPLRGLLTALESAGTPLVLVTTVDMPGVEIQQLHWLVEQIERRETATGIMCSRIYEQDVRIIEPFPSIFRASVAGNLGELFADGMRSVATWAHAGAAIAIPAPDWPARVWANLNRPEDVREFQI